MDLTDRKAPHSVAVFFDYNQRSSLKGIGAFMQDFKQPWSNGMWRLISHPEQNDTGRLLAGSCEKVSKIQIECQYDLMFVSG